MLLFIEGYPYKLNDNIRDNLTVRDALSGVVSYFNLKETTYKPEYVGYCYSKAADDVVFFLPKVVLTGARTEDDEKDTIFGASPQKIIDFDSKDLEKLFEEKGDDRVKYKEFLSELSIWIYRTISVYKKDYNDNILESRQIESKSTGRKVKHNTLLDVIIALRDFNRHNQDYFTFVARSMHRGFNKIQWGKTISKSQAIISDGVPIYINPVNKKKVVNFDEELLVIYLSILRYIKDVHGFSFDININYDLIPTKVIKSKYIDKSYGTRRLRQIKYKYFSDKALRIWGLCYAFFDKEHKIAMKVPEDDFLLAKKFEHVFEVMIDKLVAGKDKDILPQELTVQTDGKMVDHMYIDKGLLIKSELDKERTYFIGDSKYYKREQTGDVKLPAESIYKQYTYARNVIQWNMNLFLGLQETEKRRSKEEEAEILKKQPQLRDDLTEGYNPIPNFFISAHIPNKNIGEGKFLSFADDALRKEESIRLNRHFENRLFDRDTLLLCHYDVNFLFIVSLYGRDNKKRQEEWREKVRNEFRTSIQKTLNELYTFSILQPRAGMDCYGFIKENFHKLNGKIYRPQKGGNYLVLALMRKEAEEVGKISGNKLFGKYTAEEIEKNENLKLDLDSYFHRTELKKLEDELKIEGVPDVGKLEMPADFGKKDGVALVMMENYDMRQKFFTEGKIAVAMKLTEDGMTLMEHHEDIAYVLFHTRKKDENKHLFKLERPVRIMQKEEAINEGYYLVQSTAKRYICMRIDMGKELDCGRLNPSEKNVPVASKKERYDSQYSTLGCLSQNND